jgi:twinkle protein
MDIIAGFHKLDIETKGRTSGDYKTRCPQCSHLRKKKSDPSLSINLDTGLYNCHHCEWSGTVAGKPERISKKEDYSVPDINNTPLSDDLLQEVLSRGISKSTILRWGLTESEHYMVVPGANKKCVNFNYKRDGELVNIKYRDDQKNFQFSKGAELIMYGLDFVIGKEEVTICEGEYDALAFYEAGIHAVCSVPNGAPPVPKDGSARDIKMDYLDVEDFKDAKRINIATDGDEPGRRLRDELARRLGKHRCKFVLYPDGYKDANAVLLKYGRQQVKKLIEYAEDFPLDGIVTVDIFGS